MNHVARRELLGRTVVVHIAWGAEPNGRLTPNGANTDNLLG